VSGLDIFVNALSALAVAGAQIEVHGGGVDAIAVAPWAQVATRLRHPL